MQHHWIVDRNGELRAVLHGSELYYLAKNDHDGMRLATDEDLRPVYVTNPNGATHSVNHDNAAILYALQGRTDDQGRAWHFATDEEMQVVRARDEASRQKVEAEREEKRRAELARYNLRHLLSGRIDG